MRASCVRALPDRVPNPNAGIAPATAQALSRVTGDFQYARPKPGSGTLQLCRARGKQGQIERLPTMRSPLVVFDLDGTLADTNRDLIPALNRTTAREGLPAIPFSDVGHVVGHGARAMLQRAFAYHGRELTPTTEERLFDWFLVDYGQNLAVETVLFDGVLESLDHLAEAGYRLAVCTNKPEALAMRLLDALNVTQRFAAVTGGDSFAYRKPDPRHLMHTIEMAGGAAQTSLMIGDSPTDVATARAAGVPVVAVDFGYTDVPPAELGADILISHFSELTAAVAALLPAAVRN